VTLAERFGASIEITGPDPETEGFFLVTRPERVDHESFVAGLLGLIGSADRLVLHHPTGFAVVRLPFGRAQRLKRLSWVETVGGIRFDPERLAAATGVPAP